MPNLRTPWSTGLAVLSTGLSVLLLAPSAAGAQSIPSPYRFVEPGQEANAFTGLFQGDRGRFGFGPGRGLLYGLRYSVHLTNTLALEALGTYIDATRDIVNPALEEGSRVIGEAPADLFFADARLRWSLTGRRTWHGIMPYVFTGGAVGFGMSGITEVDRQLEAPDRYEFGTELGATLGAGFRVHLGDRWALRADGALLLYKIDVPRGYRDPEREFTAVPESEWTNNTGLTLGLSYLF